MQFHPILFTGEMIRANLERRKKQTRRVVMPQPVPEHLADDHGDVVVIDGEVWRMTDRRGGLDMMPFQPYGVPGDILWSRETWRIHGDSGKDKASDCYCTGPKDCEFAADFTGEELTCREWRPSIHMPKWACRLWCRVESVRVQRVQDISEADCFAEMGWDPNGTYPAEFGYANRRFAELWDSINAKRGYPWSSNCWVWAITYTVLKEAPQGWKEYCDA